MSKENERTLLITRTFDAPRELVWEVWTKPEHIAKWFGPKGFTTRVDEMDFRPGGKWRYVMIDENGKEYPSVGIFKEIVTPEKIVATDDFGEEFEKPQTSDLPEEMTVTETFEDLGEKTNLSILILHASVEDKEKHEKMGVVEGWGSTLDKFGEYLASL